MSAAKLERLLNLTALLLDAARPVSGDDIRKQVPGYPEERASFRRAFERDKDELRAMGIPLVIDRVPASSPPVDGYRIPKEHYYLRDPELTPEELTALHLAASAVRVEGLPAREGLMKLGGSAAGPVPDAAEPDPAVSVAAIPADPNLPVLFASTAARKPVELLYNGERRRVDPYRLEYQRGRWYLTGFDHLREERRSYRVDRIEGEVTDTDLPPFERPDEEPRGVALEPWQLGADEAVRARVRIDPEQAPWAVQHVGPDNVVDEPGDGGVVVELPVTNREAFCSWVLSFLDHAEILEPADLRDELIGRLHAMVEEAR
jgi:proteasome accessory factor B